MVFFNYITICSVHNTIFFYRKPRFDVKLQSFIVKTVFFLTIKTDFSVHNTIFFYRKPRFDVKLQSFIVKTVFF